MGHPRYRIGRVSAGRKKVDQRGSGRDFPHAWLRVGRGRFRHPIHGVWYRHVVALVSFIAYNTDTGRIDCFPRGESYAEYVGPSDCTER